MLFWIANKIVHNPQASPTRPDTSAGQTRRTVLCVWCHARIRNVVSFNMRHARFRGFVGRMGDEKAQRSFGKLMFGDFHLTLQSGSEAN